ncbi:MAG: YrdB family protein [Anaerolineales bacterium]
MASQTENRRIGEKESSVLKSTLSGANIFLRGLMEFSIIAAFAYWGYTTGNTNGTRILLAIAAPVIGFGFWGLVDFHQAGSAAEALRLIQELIVSGLAAAALVVSGQSALGIALAIISVVHHALVYGLGQTLLKN